MRRAGDVFGRRGNRHLKQLWGLRGLLERLSVALIVLLIGSISLFTTFKTPPVETNGYLRVRCNGGLNQQRTATCNAVLTARIMSATLVLPELDANRFSWIYDVEHFIKLLRYDVHIVETLPEISKHGKSKKDAPVNRYKTVALEVMKEHGAIFLTPFSHRLEEEIDNAEYQRLRCRVNYHALQFKPQIMKLSQAIVSKLHSQGHFMSIHLRFEMDMLSFAVGLILRAMGFDNSTRIYLAAGEFFGGDRFMKPFRALFPHLSNHNTMGLSADELAEGTHGMLGSTVDYMVCLLSDIFLQPYDGPSNVMGHRLYYGFRIIIQPDRKALAPIFIKREKGQTTDFEESVRGVMYNIPFGGPHKRIPPESLYVNSWPECFCQMNPRNTANKCQPLNIVENLNSRLQSEEGMRSSNMTDG
ncbi:hypothetical protein MKW98_011591 [Papaver atlanticum]|uniref:O-fucosyltransferase family protein n=1 Tax=Papaver atlanticum TaxID=357466 RepID=A0AAD4SP14_9MAGN|nr:hypothetical protein MKW98_011591 [Papaver atlanticum]